MSGSSTRSETERDDGGRSRLASVLLCLGLAVLAPAAAPAQEAAAEDLGADLVVSGGGAGCGTSRHEGLTAGEAGADYVGFGPVGDTSLGTGETAPRDLFAWWSEMIELPVVAEGALDPDMVAAFADVADFFALGEEVWQADDPAARLQAFFKALG